VTIILEILLALVSVVLIFFVLLQTPKQSGLSSGLGGGGDIFGGRGVEGGLVRLTSVAGALFMIIALLLSVVSR